jgi:hypothetical protein
MPRAARCRRGGRRSAIRATSSWRFGTVWSAAASTSSAGWRGSSMTPGSPAWPPTASAISCRKTRSWPTSWNACARSCPSPSITSPVGTPKAGSSPPRTCGRCSRKRRGSVTPRSTSRSGASSTWAWGPCTSRTSRRRRVEVRTRSWPSDAGVGSRSATWSPPGRRRTGCTTSCT